MTTAQFEELRDRLINMMEGVEIDFPVGSIEEEVKKAIKELKEKAKEQVEKTAESLLKENKKLSDRVKKPNVKVETKEVVVEHMDTKDVKDSVKSMEKFMMNTLDAFGEFMKKQVEDINTDLAKAKMAFLEQQLEELKKENNS